MRSNDSELITWSRTFACGIKIIDDQNKMLVDLANEIFTHIPYDDEIEDHYFNIVIQKIISYIKTHLAKEDNILDATKFLGYSEHKKAHSRFILSIVEIILERQSGKRYSLSTISRFLKDWILSHIAIMDKDYYEHLRSFATRKPDGRLTISMKDVAINNITLKKAG